MLRSQSSQRSWALFVLALLLFNFPLLMLFDRPLRLLGLPLIVWGLFGIWLLLIVAQALLMETGRDHQP